MRAIEICGDTRYIGDLTSKPCTTVKLAHESGSLSKKPRDTSSKNKCALFNNSTTESIALQIKGSARRIGFLHCVRKEDSLVFLSNLPLQWFSNFARCECNGFTRSFDFTLANVLCQNFVKY